nr:E-beta-farnesene synthase [Tanacetum cinerariifolium]
MDQDDTVVLEDDKAEDKDVIDAVKDVEKAKVDESAQVQRRQAESQAEIYKIDMDHANKVLSMQEDETEPTEVQEVVDSKDKSKRILVEELKPLKKKQQIEQDEQYARELHNELNIDIDWDEAIGHVKLKAKEDPAVKRYQDMKRKPHTKAQARKNMMMYLKNVDGFKLDYFKRMSYDNIRLIFKAKFNSNVDFLLKTKEQMKEDENKALQTIYETPAEKATKRRKLNKDVEDLKRHLQIVPNEDDDIYTEATPLARKVPVMDYEIIEMNNKPYYKIIRANGTHQLYISFLTLLSNFDIEDLEALWSLVKERFSTAKPKNFFDDFLLTALGAMFKTLNAHAQIWKNQRTVHVQAKLAVIVDVWCGLTESVFIVVTIDSRFTDSNELTRSTRNLSNVVTNDTFQPGRALTTIINLCLTGKTSGFERPRAPVLQILWGVVNRARIDYAERIWEEFTQSIHTFIEDKKNLAQHTYRKKKATLIVIPSIRFTKMIIYYLQRKHKFHPRPDSPLHLPNEEPVLGYLKFSAKGTKQEFFGMPIPDNLITVDIQGEPYYKEYPEKVAKHQRYLAGEKRSNPDSPAPKPAKATKKSKPSAPKADLRPPVTIPASSQQPEPIPAPANSLRSVDESVDKGIPEKEPRVDDEEDGIQRALEESLKSVYNVPRGPLPPVIIREPKSEKYQQLPEVQGKGKEKVTDEHVALDLLTLQTPKKKSPADQFIYQRHTSTPTESSGIDEGVPGEGQAGPNPGFTATAYPNAQENLKLTIEEQVILEEPASSIGNLSSLQHLAKDLSSGDLFFNDKPSEADNEKTTAETEAESMVSVIIQQDTFSIPPITTPIIDLTLRPDSPNVHRLLQATETKTTTTTTTTTHPPPPQPQQSTINSMLIKRISELEQIMANLIQDNKHLEESSTPESLQRLARSRHKRDSSPTNVGMVEDVLSTSSVLAVRSSGEVYEPHLRKTGGLAHIPKVNLRQDLWKPLEEDRPATPEPAWSIPSSDLPVPKNNWASALASVDESVDEGIPEKETRFDNEEAEVQRALEESLKSVYDAPWGPLPPTPKKKRPANQFIFQRRTSMPTESSGHDESSSLYAELGLINSEVESDEDVPRINAGKVGELEHIMTNLIQDNKHLEERLDSHGSRLYTLENLDIPQQVSKAVDEIVTDAVDWAIQALLRNRFRDLLEADMKEILYQRIWETNSYKTYEDHMMLYEALEKSMNRDHTDELLKIWLKHAKRRKRVVIHRIHHLGLHLNNHLLLYHQQEGQPHGSIAPSSSKTAASAKYKAWTMTATRIMMSVSSTPEDLHMDDDMAPDAQVHSFDDEDIENTHIPKANLWQDWWNPLKENRPATPEPAYKGSRPALSISKMKAAYYPDIGLEQMVPDQMWFGEECTYEIASMYGISHRWFQRQRFYINRYTSEGDRRAVRTHMQIFSVFKIEAFSMYGYDYMKKIILHRADLNEHIITKRDFKYLYPSDFEDLYLLNLQGNLNHLPPKEKKILTTVVNLWTRHLVIKQQVEDFQLGIESYQTQLNLTKPRWDATSFKYKHKYTIIDSPRAVTFWEKYGVRIIMRFNEIHKFSDGTLHQMDEALDYRVKEFKVNRMNLRLNTRFWTRKDVDRSKEFMFVIQKRLKTRRIFLNLESFIGGRVRDGDYRLLNLRSLKPKHTLESRTKRSSKLISLGHYSIMLASLHTVKSKTDIKSPTHYPCGMPEHPSDKQVFTVKMEILLEPPSNKLLVANELTNAFGKPFELKDLQHSFRNSDACYYVQEKCGHTGEIAIGELRKKLEIAQKEKDGIQLNVDKFKHASKSLNKLIECQIVDICKKGLGYKNYNVVPPPYTGNFMSPTPDLSFTGIDEFVNKPVAENCKAKSSEEEPKVVRKNNDAPIIEEWVSDNEEENVSQPKIEKKSVRPSIAKIEFVKSKQQEKTARKTVKQVEQHRQNTHKYEEIDGGYVAFGWNPKGRKVIGKCTIKTGSGPDWLFDIDALTRTMNYKPIVTGLQSNGFTDPIKESECKDQEKQDNVNSTNNVNTAGNVNTISLTVNAAGTNEVNVVGENISIEL